MSLIEKFYLLFETDASAAASEIKKAEAVTKDVDLAMSNAARSNQRLAASFVGTLSAVRAFSAAFGATAWALDGSLKRAGEIDTLSRIANRARIATGDLDLFGRSARTLSGDVETAQSDLQNLADNALDALGNQSGAAAKTFAALGLQLKDSGGNIKNTKQIILDLADATQKLSAGNAESQLKKLGLSDPGAVKLILSGKKAILENIEAQRKAGEITERQVEVSRKYKQAQEELQTAITQSTNDTLEAVLPAATWIIDKFKELILFFREHKVLATGFFSAVALGITAFYLPAVISAAAATWGWAIAVLAATWPLLAIIAAAALFALVLEDVYAYMTGQDSMIGGLAKKYPLVAEGLKVIGNIWEWLKSRAEPVIDFFKAVWGMVVSLWNGDIDGFKKHFWEALAAIKKYFLNVFNDLKNIVGPIVDWIKGKLWNMLPDWAKRWLGGEGDQKRAEHEQIEEAKAAVEAGKSGVSSANATYIPPSATAKIENNTDVRVDAPANITINATDSADGAKQAAEIYHKNMTETFNRAAADFDTGVAR